MPDHRETTINVMHDEKVAHIWTNHRATHTRLVKCGYKPFRAQNGGHWYQVPAKAVRFRAVVTTGQSAAQKAATAKARAARRKQP